MAIELIPNNTSRIVLLWVCLYTLTLWLNHVSLAVENANQNEKYKIINKLVVNNKNEYKTIIFKNEGEGILEMRELIDSSQIEECWIYLPHHEKWIEIGYNEESEKKINDCYITKARLDVRFMDWLMNENNNMIVYHFHSSYCLSLEDEIKERKERGLPMSDNEIEKEKIRFLIKSAYPSRSDLMNMIVNTIEFFERNLDGNITFKIGSHYGITEYHLTEEGRIHFYTNNSFPPARPSTPFASPTMSFWWGRGPIWAGKQIKGIISISSSANIEANVKGEILEMNPRETRDPLERIKMSPKQKRSSLSRYKTIDAVSKIERSVEAMNNELLRVTFTPY